MTDNTKTRKTKHKVGPIDKAIGQKVRQLRLLAGWSQKEFGERLEQSVSFQQVQKYENGTNRVSAAGVLDIAQIFGVPLTAFFEISDDLETRQFMALTKRALKLAVLFDALEYEEVKDNFMSILIMAKERKW